MSEHIFEALIWAVETAAEWRHEKAQQYPDDRRNETAAAGLERLSANLRAAPRSGELAALIRRYTEIYEHEHARPESIGEAESDYIRTFGFSGTDTTDPVEFLKGLIEELEQA